MKATELRIGNYLQDNVTKTTIKVVELTNECITTYVIDRSKFPLKDGWKLEPIPLTEEWLLKFGFENEKNVMNLRINEDLYLIFTKSNTDKIIFIQSFEENDNGGMEMTTIFPLCQHVHQLQNLYFALTQEELFLNDKI